MHGAQSEVHLAFYHAGRWSPTSAAVRWLEVGEGTEVGAAVVCPLPPERHTRGVGVTLASEAKLKPDDDKKNKIFKMKNDGDAREDVERESSAPGEERGNSAKDSTTDTGGASGDKVRGKESPVIQRATDDVQTTWATQKKKKKKEQEQEQEQQQQQRVLELEPEEEEWHPWRRSALSDDNRGRRRLSANKGGGGLMKFGALALLLRLDRPGQFPASAVKRSFDGGRTWGPLEFRPPGVATAVGGGSCAALFTETSGGESVLGESFTPFDGHGGVGLAARAASVAVVVPTNVPGEMVCVAQDARWAPRVGPARPSLADSPPSTHTHPPSSPPPLLRLPPLPLSSLLIPF